MGIFIHDAAIFVTRPIPAVEDGVNALREAMPEQYRHLLVGPLSSDFNTLVTYAFLPDGSKEGWPESDQADAYRAQFIALFAGSYADGVTVRFGRDLFQGLPYASLPFAEEND